MPRAAPQPGGLATTTALTPLAAKMPAARTAGPDGINRYVSRSRAKNAVNRRDGLEALGKPEANAVAPAHAPAGQPGRQPISAMGQRRHRTASVRLRPPRPPDRGRKAAAASRS